MGFGWPQHELQLQELQYACYQRTELMMAMMFADGLHASHQAIAVISHLL